MTAYCTPAQVKAVLTRNPALPGGSAADVGDDVIQSRIDAAQTEVDVMLAARYTVPFDTAPAIVAQITIAVAAYLVELVHRQGLGVPMTDQDPAVRLYQWGHQALRSLAAGTADLPTTSQPTEGRTRSVGTFDITPGGMFDRASFGLEETPPSFTGRWP